MDSLRTTGRASSRTLSHIHYDELQPLERLPLTAQWTRSLLRLTALCCRPPGRSDRTRLILREGRRQSPLGPFVSLPAMIPAHWLDPPLAGYAIGLEPRTAGQNPSRRILAPRTEHSHSSILLVRSLTLLIWMGLTHWNDWRSELCLLADRPSLPCAPSLRTRAQGQRR